MDSKKEHNELIETLEEFYVNLREIAKKYGYLLDYLRAEAPPCDAKGKPLPFHELLRIYGDIPEDWHWRYKSFLENNEHVAEKVLRALTGKGYRVFFYFTVPDALLGNIVVGVKSKIFAIGECYRDSEIIPHNKRGQPLYSMEGCNEYMDIKVMRLWSPFYVLANIRRMEVKIQNKISV